VIYYPKNPVFIQFDSSIMLGEPQWDEFMFLEAALKLSSELLSLLGVVMGFSLLELFSSILIFPLSHYYL
jgi:hypothetical protein